MARNRRGRDVLSRNRPEDLEWNPKDFRGKPRLYIAFTNHTGGTQLDQNGKLLQSDVADKRSDQDGEIFALQETDTGNPAGSKTFTYFQVGSIYSQVLPARFPQERKEGMTNVSAKAPSGSTTLPSPNSLIGWVIAWAAAIFLLLTSLANNPVDLVEGPILSR